MNLIFLLASLSVFAAELPRDTGYSGIWYFNQPGTGPGA
jgi:hypothetical protein